MTERLLLVHRQQLYRCILHELIDYSNDAVTHAYILYYTCSCSFTIASGGSGMPALPQQQGGSSVSARNVVGSVPAASSTAQQPIRYDHTFSVDIIQVATDERECTRLTLHILAATALL
jgi:hypothetical protein